MNTAKIEYMPCTNPQGVAAPWGFILGLPSCVLTVKPLAYVVANYTRSHRHQEARHKLHARHPLPAPSMGKGSENTISQFDTPRNDKIPAAERSQILKYRVPYSFW